MARWESRDGSVPKLVWHGFYIGSGWLEEKAKGVSDGMVDIAKPDG